MVPMIKFKLFNMVYDIYSDIAFECLNIFNSCYFSPNPLSASNIELSHKSTIRVAIVIFSETGVGVVTYIR